MRHTAHLYFPATRQDSVYDYEGWAHSRGAFRKEHVIEGDLEAAHQFLSEQYSPWLYGILRTESFIADEAGGRHPVRAKAL